MTMSEIATKQSYPCNDCQAGVMRLQFITYFTWLSDELITVPNFPAWICDVCGRREYDQKARTWLSALLNPDTGKGTGVKKPLPPALPRRNPTRLTPE